jgi:hypothetical protein
MVSTADSVPRGVGRIWSANGLARPGHCSDAMSLMRQGLEGQWGSGAGQLAVELVSCDHQRALLGASTFGGPCGDLLHPLLTLDRSGVVQHT